MMMVMMMRMMMRMMMMRMMDVSLLGTGSVDANLLNERSRKMIRTCIKLQQQQQQ